jgi:hypothetical protein
MIQHDLRDGKTKEAYADWLQSKPWDYFLTTTFRSPRKEPYYAIKHVWNTLKPHGIGRAFLACEPHQSGDLHIHGIVAGLMTRQSIGDGGEIYVPTRYKRDGQLRLDPPEVIWGDLFKVFGRSKVELCRSNEDVAGYCAKYVLKQQSRVCDYYGVFGGRRQWN